jgi:hypothetical protein
MTHQIAIVKTHTSRTIDYKPPFAMHHHIKIAVMQAVLINSSPIEVAECGLKDVLFV